MYRRENHKNLVSMIVLLVGTLLTGGCGLGGKNSLEQVEKDNRFLINSIVVPDGDGNYYFSNKTTDADKGYIFFLDGETEKIVRLCGKADCTHDTEDCNAIVKGMGNLFLQFVGDKLYYLQQADRYRVVLCSMNKDGTDHHEITTVFNIMGDEFYWPRGFFHKGYFYYEIYSPDGGTLYRVKVADGAEPEVFLELEGEGGDYLAQGDYLYFSRYITRGSVDTAGEVLRLSIETGEEEIFYQWDGKQIISSMILTEDYLYYSVGSLNGNGGVWRHNLKTGEDEPFGTGLPEFVGLFTDGHYIYVDNLNTCEMIYEDDYERREILILDMEGNQVDVFSMPGKWALPMGGDEKYMFFNAFGVGDNILLYYDKSQIGTGGNELHYIERD